MAKKQVPSTTEGGAVARAKQRGIPQEVVEMAETVATLVAPQYEIKGNQAVIGAVKIAAAIIAANAAKQES